MTTRASMGVIWFSRILLGAATLLMTVIALRALRDPIAAMREVDIVPTSPMGATIARVGFGGFPLGLAISLGVCVASTRRLRSGLGLLLVSVGAVTAARIQGIVVDGPTAYNLVLLRPEFAMLALGTLAFVLESRRRAVTIRSSRA